MQPGAIRLFQGAQSRIYQVKLPSIHRQPRVSVIGCRKATSNSKQAIIIVDHGSRRAESNKQLDEFVALYRRLYDQQMAIAAHMEIAGPSIREAVAQCAQEGYKEIVIAPYFLSQGRHIQQDIPALVAEAQAEHPDLRCVIAEPIGIDRTVADIIHSRVASATAQAP